MGKFKLEIYFDERISSTHIEKHGVTEIELIEFFEEIRYLQRKRGDGSYVAVGKLKDGRFLQVVFRQPSPGTYFVITAYDLEDRELIEILEQHLDP